MDEPWTKFNNSNKLTSKPLERKSAQVISMDTKGTNDWLRYSLRKILPVPSGARTTLRNQPQEVKSARSRKVVVFYKSWRRMIGNQRNYK